MFGGVHVLLGVAQQSHASQRPVSWIATRLQQQREDVRQIRTTWLLVHRTLVQLVRLASLRVDGEDVYDRNHRVKHLRRWFNQLRVSSIPTGSVQEETVHVHTLKNKDIRTRT